MSDPGVSTVVERLFAGDRRALARSLTWVESRDPRGDEVIAALEPATRAPVIGFTGAPGAGKSTLISAVTAEMRNRKRRVAVLAIDPTSPLLGGATLGDRLRMSEHLEDREVFVRSMASRGALGGLSARTIQSTRLLDAWGSDAVLLESVGVGQNEVDIAYAADSVVLLLAPGGGDSIQALKSGVMEIPDIIAINYRGDRAQATQMERELRGMLSVNGFRVPVVTVNAATADGLGELVDTVDAHGGDSGKHRLTREQRARGAIRMLALEELGSMLDRSLRQHPDGKEIVDLLASEKISPEQAARAALDAMSRTPALTD